LHNGIIVQNHVKIKGKTEFTGQPTYKKHNFQLPLLLQEHDSPVSFKNIWIREINVIKLFNQDNLQSWYT